LTNLEAFLGFPLGRIIVREDAVGRWRMDDKSAGEYMFDFFADAMAENGYEVE
jgi:hypothetical protein